jgi:hypothetical protein
MSCFLCMIFANDFFLDVFLTLIDRLGVKILKWVMNLVWVILLKCQFADFFLKKFYQPPFDLTLSLSLIAL